MLQPKLARLLAAMDPEPRPCRSCGAQGGHWASCRAEKQVREWAEEASATGEGTYFPFPQPHEPEIEAGRQTALRRIFDRNRELFLSFAQETSGAPEAVAPPTPGNVVHSTPAGVPADAGPARAPEPCRNCGGNDETHQKMLMHNDGYVCAFASKPAVFEPTSTEHLTPEAASAAGEEGIRWALERGAPCHGKPAAPEPSEGFAGLEEQHVRQEAAAHPERVQIGESSFTPAEQLRREIAGDDEERAARALLKRLRETERPDIQVCEVMRAMRAARLAGLEAAAKDCERYMTECSAKDPKRCERCKGARDLAQDIRELGKREGT